MAYLDLFPVPSAAGIGDRKAFALRAAFDPRERTVIEMARADGLSSVFAPGRWRALIEAMFRVRRANRLADPKLESLRRLVVLMRHGRDRDADQGGFIKAGYSAAQLAVLAMEVRP